MTLHDLEDRLLEHFNYDASAGETAPRRRIRRHLNTWHRRILTMPMYSRLREATTQVASVAGTAEYGLRVAVSRILRIYERTNDQVLSPQSVDWYRSIEPDPQQGTPEYWIPLGYTPTATDPASTGLWVASSAAGDTAQAVHLQGVADPDLLVLDNTVTLTGTTRVQFGTTTTYRKVTKFYLDKETAGTVTLYNAAASGTTLAVIPAGVLFSRYFRFALWPTPASVVTYYVDYEAAVQDLYAATDEPWVPEDFHDLLELGARIEEYEKENDTRLATTRAMLARRLSDLTAHLDVRPGYVGIPGEMMASRPSRLGPWFPAGT